MSDDKEKEIKKLKTKIKRCESTAKTYDEQGKRYWAYYENGGRPDPFNNHEHDPNTVGMCYKKAQNAFAERDEQLKKAEELKAELAKLER